MVVNNHVVNVETEDANVFAFITHLVPPSGGGSFVVGKGWIGTLCHQNKGYRTSINSWVSSDLALARVRYSFCNQ